MMSAMTALPKELPESPKGWTQSLIMHMNYGEAGGSATYKLKDESGREMPIIYGYDTRLPPVNGFKLDGCDEILSWREVRAKWPAWLVANEKGES